MSWADRRLPVLLPLASGTGFVIGVIDSGPNWDDTGVTVAALLAGAAIFGAISPRYPWLWGIAVGMWVPLIEIALPGGAGGYAPAVAILIALAGAYAGAIIGRMVWTTRTES